MGLIRLGSPLATAAPVCAASRPPLPHVTCVPQIWWTSLGLTAARHPWTGQNSSTRSTSGRSDATRAIRGCASSLTGIHSRLPQGRTRPSRRPRSRQLFLHPLLLPRGCHLRCHPRRPLRPSRPVLRRGRHPSHRPRSTCSRTSRRCAGCACLTSSAACVTSAASRSPAASATSTPRQCRPIRTGPPGWRASCTLSSAGARATRPRGRSTCSRRAPATTWEAVTRTMWARSCARTMAPGRWMGREGSGLWTRTSTASSRVGYALAIHSPSATAPPLSRTCRWRPTGRSVCAALLRERRRTIRPTTGPASRRTTPSSHSAQCRMPCTHTTGLARMLQQTMLTRALPREHAQRATQ